MRVLILQEEIQRKSHILEVQQAVPLKVDREEGDPEHPEQILPGFQAGQREGADQVAERPDVHLNYI